MNRTILVAVVLFAPFCWVQGYTLNVLLLKRVENADDLFWVAVCLLPIINLLASFQLFESAQRVSKTFSKLAISIQEGFILGFVIGIASAHGLGLVNQLYLGVLLIIIPFNAGTLVWYWYFVQRVKKGLDS